MERLICQNGDGVLECKCTKPAKYLFTHKFPDITGESNFLKSGTALCRGHIPAWSHNGVDLESPVTDYLGRRESWFRLEVLPDPLLTAGDLIAELSKLNPDAIVEIAVHPYTSRFPVIYQTLISTTADRGYEESITRFDQSTIPSVRITIHTPEGIVISKRNKIK